MKIEEVFKKLKPISGENLDRLWQEYILADAKTQRNIEDALKVILAKNLNETFEGKEILLEPPRVDVAYREYPLGFIYYGKDRFHLFGLREEEWVQQLGIFGMSGSRKTNVGFIIVLVSGFRSGSGDPVPDIRVREHHTFLLTTKGKSTMIRPWLKLLES